MISTMKWLSLVATVDSSADSRDHSDSDCEYDGDSDSDSDYAYDATCLCEPTRVCTTRLVGARPADPALPAFGRLTLAQP